MNKQQVKSILDYIQLNYSNFEITQKLFDMWLDELQQYDYEDVMSKLKELIASGSYRVQPPVLLTITSGLTKTSKKLDWSKTITFCKNCNKAFQCDETGYSKEYEIHRTKCNSIQYVILQTKKWFYKDLTRAELWQMPEVEFEERYDKLLHYIYDHTQNDMEKEMIGHIFETKEN